MDTSTSQEQKELTTGTPDSQMVETDLINFILCGELSGEKKISPKDWLRILDEVLNSITPHIQYIDGLKTIEQIVENERWFRRQEERKSINIGLEFLPPGAAINAATRGFFVFTAESLPQSKATDGIARYTNLILTEHKQWVEWSLFCKDLRYHSQLILLSRGELLAFLGCAEQVGGRILESIHNILYGSKQKKAERLEQIEYLEKLVKGIMYRTL